MRDWLVHIRKDSRLSLQAQIREALVSAILDGALDRNEPVPSTRKMARLLGVSRNTVVLAYQSLLDDGYLSARERSGYFVSEKAITAHARRPRNAPRKRAACALDWEKRLRFRPGDQDIVIKPADWADYRYPFVYGQVDENLFPLAEWRECARQALGRRFLSNWIHDTPELDDPLLVEQIRRRILPRRGIMAHDDEILVTLGAQHALSMLAQLLAGEDTTVGMEDPGYADARNIFSMRAGRMRPLPMEEDGVSLEGVKECDLLYVTPSHQFPTTVTMSLDKRLRLLRAACAHDFIIIEDDYEFEANYVNEPCPSLKSLDDEGRVIYVGSMSKSLFPGLRMGFMVGPARLIEEARALRRLMVRHPPSNNQRTVAMFLSLGHYDTLVRRMHRVLRERWEIMSEALHAHLPHATEAPSFGGSSFWVRGPEWLDDVALWAKARERGILTEPGSVYYAGEFRPRNRFRLGFSAIPTERIRPGVKLLAETIEQMRPSRGAAALPAGAGSGEMARRRDPGGGLA